MPRAYSWLSRLELHHERDGQQQFDPVVQAPSEDHTAQDQRFYRRRQRLDLQHAVVLRNPVQKLERGPRQLAWIPHLGQHQERPSYLRGHVDTLLRVDADAQTLNQRIELPFGQRPQQIDQLERARARWREVGAGFAFLGHRTRGRISGGQLTGGL
jgi:hypothetical protein